MLGFMEEKMKYALFLIVFLLLGCTATTDDSPSQVVYAENELDSPNAWIIKIEPKYPLKQYNDGTEGHVKFTAVVNENGKLEDINITESVPKGVFDDYAINALEKWRFRPAKKNGKPVKSIYSDELVWQLQQ
jgi:protein TonB